MNNENNVIPLKPHYSLFNKELRDRLESEVKPYTEEAGAAVRCVENAICTHLVSIARRTGEKLAAKLGERLFGTTGT